MTDAEASEPSMMERFAASSFEPVEFEGETVHAMYWAAVKAGDVVEVEWLSAASPRTQGVMLRLRKPGVTGKKGVGGTLAWEGNEGAAVRLWMDKSGPSTEVTCAEVAADAKLRITNVWVAPGGRVDEYLNNYGIKVEIVDDDTALLHCSDGIGQRPTFDDQIVRITLRRSRHG